MTDTHLTIRQADGAAQEVASDLLRRFFAEEGFAVTPPGVAPALPPCSTTRAAPSCWRGATAPLDEPAGIATASWRTTVEHVRLAEIGALYVAPGARGRGSRPRSSKRSPPGPASRAAPRSRSPSAPTASCSHGVTGFSPRRGFDDEYRKVLSRDCAQAAERRGDHVTPPPGAPREEGFSKDADKLIRRLSLVAFLLSRPGRPATAAEIRQRVEGYALMSDDAFKRRFYEDRAELAGLGIGIVGDADGEGETEVYALPASAYYLPAIEFTPDELSALSACLFVLEHRFAYSEPLRLALLSLTHGRPELLSPAAATPVSVLPEREARRAAAAAAQAAAGGRGRQDGGLRLLLDRARRGAPAYRRPLRPAAGRRRVVSHRSLSPAPGDPHLPPLAPALAGDVRHPGAPRLRAAGELLHRRLPRPARLAARRTRGPAPPSA